MSIKQTSNTRMNSIKGKGREKKHFRECLPNNYTYSLLTYYPQTSLTESVKKKWEK